MADKLPTPANGKICYIEMPANDINTSAAFYKEVFGWNIRQRGDGAPLLMIQPAKLVVHG